jgi:hypothetical protein
VQFENSEGYGSYTKTAEGVEIFTMTKNPDGSRQRVEARVNNDYTTGRHQFDGYVWIKKGAGGVTGNSGPDAAVCVHQIWQFIMVIVFNLDNGDLRQHSNNRLITNAYERWIRVTSIHDVEKKWAAVYIDGELKWQGADGGYQNNNWYFKYGIYNGAGSNPEVRWKNIRYFVGGNPPDQVQKQNQTIVFNRLPIKTINDADFDPGATSSSGLPVSYTSSDTSVAKIIDNKIRIVGEGTTIIKASQPGTSLYNQSNEVNQNLYVTSVVAPNQIIIFPPIPSKIVGDADFDPGALASSGLPVIYTSSDTTVASIVNGKIHLKKTGTTTITAAQAGDGTYNPAPNVTQTIAVAAPVSVLEINDSATGIGENQFEFVGTWKVTTGQTGNYNDDFTESKIVDDYVKIRFTGRQISLYGKKKPDSGIAAFSIDGGLENEGDFYAAAETKMAKIWTSPMLPYGEHILKCRIKGTKNTASSGYLCRIDYVEINRSDSVFTTVEQTKTTAIIPSEYKLESYPNPFNPSTNITYKIPVGGYVTMNVYDILGREVAMLVNKMEMAGTHTVNFEASNLTSGVYITRLKVQPQDGGRPIVQTLKIMLSK